MDRWRNIHKRLTVFSSWRGLNSCRGGGGDSTVSTTTAGIATANSSQGNVASSSRNSGQPSGRYRRERRRWGHGHRGSSSCGTDGMGHVTRTCTMMMMMMMLSYSVGRRRKLFLIYRRGRQRHAPASCRRISLREGRGRRGRCGIRTICGERAKGKSGGERGWLVMMGVVFLIVRGRVGEERGRLIV